MSLERLLISAAAGAFTAYHLIEVYGLPMRLKRGFSIKPEKRIKPFDCLYCLGGWLSLIFYFTDISIYFALLFGSAYLSSKL